MGATGESRISPASEDGLTTNPSRYVRKGALFLRRMPTKDSHAIELLLPKTSNSPRPGLARSLPRPVACQFHRPRRRKPKANYRSRGRRTPNENGLLQFAWIDTGLPGYMVGAP